MITKRRIGMLLVACAAATVMCTAAYAAETSATPIGKALGGSANPPSALQRVCVQAMGLVPDPKCSSSDKSGFNLCSASADNLKTVSIDQHGNLVDQDGNIIRQAGAFNTVEASQSLSATGTTVITCLSDSTVDKSGNLTDKDGKIIVAADKLHKYDGPMVGPSAPQHIAPKTIIGTIVKN